MALCSKIIKKQSMEELGIYSFSQDDFWEKIFGSEWADDPH